MEEVSEVRGVAGQGDAQGRGRRGWGAVKGLTGNGVAGEVKGMVSLFLVVRREFEKGVAVGDERGGGGCRRDWKWTVRIGVLVRKAMTHMRVILTVTLILFFRGRREVSELEAFPHANRENRSRSIGKYRLKTSFKKAITIKTQSYENQRKNKKSVLEPSNNA